MRGPLDEATREADVAGALRREAALILTKTMTASPTAKGTLEGEAAAAPLVLARAAAPVEAPEVAREREVERGFQVDEELHSPRPPSGAAADVDEAASPEAAEAERLRAQQDLNWELGSTPTASPTPTSSVYSKVRPGWRSPRTRWWGQTITVGSFLR